jgi:hypothetical protein
MILLFAIRYFQDKRKKERFDGRMKSHDNLRLQMIKKALIPLDPRIEYLNFYENSEESYTLGKKDIYICPFEDENTYHSDNFLVYIALHEIAHALIPEDTRDHPPVFDRMFEDLKRKAVQIGIYNPSLPFPSKTCRKSLKYY